MSSKDVFFIPQGSILTKGDADRTFEGWGSVEVIDKEGDFIPMSALKEIMPILVNERGGPIIDSHSNRVVGKIEGYEFGKNEDGEDGVWIKGRVYNHYAVDDYVWNKIREGEYKGLSLGGEAFDVEPVTINGKRCNKIKNPQVLEWSIVSNPANQGSYIKNVNYIAKSDKSPDQLRENLARHLLSKSFSELSDTDKTSIHNTAVIVRERHPSNEIRKDFTESEIVKLKKLLKMTEEKPKDVAKDTTLEPSKVLDEKPTGASPLAGSGVEKEDAPEETAPMAEPTLADLGETLSVIADTMQKVLKAVAKEDMTDEEEEKPEETPEVPEDEEEKMKAIAQAEVKKALAGATKSETPRPAIEKSALKPATGGGGKLFEKGVIDKSWRQLNVDFEEDK